MAKAEVDAREVREARRFLREQGDRLGLNGAPRIPATQHARYACANCALEHGDVLRTFRQDGPCPDCGEPLDRM